MITYRLRRANPIPPAVLVSETVLHRAIVRLCRLVGARVYFTLRSKGSPRGWPDLVILRPPHMWIWELKTEKGHLTADQAETLKLLASVREIHVGVVRPSDWDRVVQELSQP